MIRRPPRSTRTDTLFPYTTLFRAKGGGYVRTEAGLSFVAPEPPTFQQRLLMEELQRASGQHAVAAVIDRAGVPEPDKPAIDEMWEHAKEIGRASCRERVCQ